jgi:hypothetical protein
MRAPRRSRRPVQMEIFPEPENVASPAFGVPTFRLSGPIAERLLWVSGSIAVDETRLHWKLVSEPQWVSGQGFKGLCIPVQVKDGRYRELILEFPFPKKANRIGMPQIPQRPQLALKAIETAIRQAMAAGWNPTSRGKKFVFPVV